jgi:hypothetical protein
VLATVAPGVEEFHTRSGVITGTLTIEKRVSPQSPTISEE